MIKMIGLLKRNPDLSPEEFRRHYETRHRLIGEKYLRAHAKKYMRRYLQPFPDPITGLLPKSPYDVVLEIWYETRKAFDAANETFSRPEVAREIADDEETLFDRRENRFFFVDEVVSDLGRVE